MSLRIESLGTSIDLNVTDKEKREFVTVDVGLPREQISFMGYEEGAGGAAFGKKLPTVEVPAGETKTITGRDGTEYTLIGSD